MDFFGRQRDIKSRSLTFYLAFALAVAATVVVYYLAVTAAFGILSVFSLTRLMPQGTGLSGIMAAGLPEVIYGSPPQVLSLRPFLIIGALIVAVVMLASSYKVRAIRLGGGAYLAEAMGGRLIRTPQNAGENRLVNVIEEMSVASGLPRPQIYVLDEESTINAVTGGLRPDDTVIVVTRGALVHLNRRELRAVMAHEFAHILNGDFSLNLTMAGWLYGLLFFSMKGQELLDDALEVMDRLLSRTWYRFGGLLTNYPGLNYLAFLLAIPAYLAGVALALGGWIGRVAASAVQAAFSRQREYLADAFAVQFTRETEGLAGALKKIAGLPKHGVLRSGQAIMMRAFFIVSPSRADGLLRTHPPLEDRILALEPHWDGEFTVLDHPDYRPPEPPADFHVPVVNFLGDKTGPATPLSRFENRFQQDWTAALTSLSLLAAGEALSADQAPAADPAPAEEKFGTEWAEGIKNDAALILSALAHRDGAGPDEAERAYAAAQTHFQTLWPPLPLADEPQPQELNQALTRAGQAPLNIRRLLALAAITAAVEGGRLGPERRDLLSSLSTALNISLTA